jgi:hypothetical protein
MNGLAIYQRLSIPSSTYLAFSTNTMDKIQVFKDRCLYEGLTSDFTHANSRNTEQQPLKAQWEAVKELLWNPKKEAPDGLLSDLDVKAKETITLVQNAWNKCTGLIFYQN